MENGKGYLYETKSNSRVAIVLFFLTDQIQVNLLLQNSS